MALEPITRQEQIVAGKDLEPITRMEKFLKDYGVSNYFGETTVKGDTLTWDGNTEGLVSIDLGGTLGYRISGATPTLADFANGYIIHQDGEDLPQDAELVRENNGMIFSDVFFIFPTDNFDFMGNIIPKAGFYVPFSDPISLTIPGYNGFETTTIKTIDAKYLPPLVSPGGKKFKLYVDDSGVLSATEV